MISILLEPTWFDTLLCFTPCCEPLQFEDFQTERAFEILHRHRSKLLCCELCCSRRCCAEL